MGSLIVKSAKQRTIVWEMLFNLRDFLVLITNIGSYLVSAELINYEFDYDLATHSLKKGKKNISINTEAS